jgi:hypothetical protein
MFAERPCLGRESTGPFLDSIANGRDKTRLQPEDQSSFAETSFSTLFYTDFSGNG